MLEHHIFVDIRFLSCFMRYSTFSVKVYGGRRKGISWIKTRV